MSFLAKLLSGVATQAADEGSNACFGFIWEEPTCPEEIL